MSQIIDGKACALGVRRAVAQEALAFRARYGRVPALHVILVGDDEGSASYVRGKEKALVEAGLVGNVHRLPASTSESAVHELVARLNRDPAVDGILVQLPLPPDIAVDALLESVDPAKDVDGFHPVNVGRLWSGKPGLVPCTPRGCLRLLLATGVRLEGARALVVGRSNLVGRPMAALLLNANATVDIAHSKSRDLAELCREADVLVVAAGQLGLVQGGWIKPGSAVIDVGIHRVEDGRLAGDVDFETARHVAAWITPVPGGVGPMTIAMLLDNTLRAARVRAGESYPSLEAPPVGSPPPGRP
jgi:methylenetetrahydrofolate dehydrogenase (NADP+)/methenyltetrahydrofolate cyclohydrolase